MRGEREEGGYCPTLKVVVLHSHDAATSCLPTLQHQLGIDWLKKRARTMEQRSCMQEEIHTQIPASV